MSSLSVVGTGYVGLTTAACLADLGHEVVALDIDASKIATLKQGKPTIYEPGLQELMTRAIKADRLRFTTEYADAIPNSEFVFVAVGTPMGRRGEADLVFVKQAARSIAKAMKRTMTIINKSTVPIGTGDIVSRIIGENLEEEIPFSVVSNPEFLREGSAIHDFMHPDRLVFGSHSRPAAEAVAAIYARLDTNILITDLHTAEMIKYASNAFLATRISFINEIARICERVDADVKLLVEKLREVLGGLRDQVIAVLGLAYKPNTDDVREAPAIDVINSLKQKGARVRAYDPKAMPVLKQTLNDIQYCRDAYEAANGADAVLLVTEWEEFRQLDLERMKRVMRRPVIVDGRNLYEPNVMRELGFVYRGVGRS